MIRPGRSFALSTTTSCLLVATTTLVLCSLSAVDAFAPIVAPSSTTRHVVSQTAEAACLWQLLASSSSSTEDTTTSSNSMNSLEDNVALLQRAATTKQEDSDDVFEALSQLEKQMRQQVRADPAVADEMLRQLNGSWRLIFTTGTAKTQEKSGRRINYFPLKAIQSFRTVTTAADGDDSNMGIENGIYFGDWPAVKFSGTMDFDKKKCRLSFSFDRIALLGGLLDIPLAAGQAEELGSKSGLGSESNVVNAARDKQAFFNWISADQVIATARGGGGGLALWKRVE